MSAYRSMLYIPGNSPSLLQHAPIFGSDSVLLDLEDAVALSEKDAARKLVRHMIETLDFGRILVTVRVNGADTPFFERDLEEIIPACPGAIRLPKCGAPENVRAADAKISALEERHGIASGSVRLHAMIETAAGVVNANAIAGASPRLSAITIGGQDLIADMGAKKSREGWEIFSARGQIVIAAKSRGLDVYDTVWTDVNDNEGLFEETKRIVAMGFTGKAAIHPMQVPVIHSAFTPEPREIDFAGRVIRAAEEARRDGRGVFSVDGKMVDGPIIAQAARVLELAALSKRGGVQ